MSGTRYVCITTAVASATWSHHMKIIDLELTNVRTFKDVKFRIPDGVSLLLGENGTGKSTLLGTAAAWAIWGQVPGRSQDHLVRHGEREMVVRVNLTAHNKPYSIERRFRLNKKGKGGDTKLSLYQKKQGDWFTDIANLTQPINKETQQVITEIFGRYEVWAATAYVGQKEGAGYFLEAKPADRRAILREIIAADDNWTEWELSAKDEVRQRASQIERLSGTIPILDERASQTEELEVALSTLEVDLREIQDPLDKAEHKLKQATRSYEGLNTDEWKLQQEIQSLKQQSNDYRSAKSLTTTVKHKLQVLDQQLAIDTANAEKLPQAEKEHRAHIERMQQVESESNSIKELNNVEIKKWHKALEAQKNSTKERCESCKQLIEPEPVEAPKLLKEPILLIRRLDLEQNVQGAIRSKERIEASTQRREELAEQLKETAAIMFLCGDADQDMDRVIDELKVAQKTRGDAHRTIQENTLAVENLQEDKTVAIANIARAEISYESAKEAKQKLAATQKEITDCKESLADWERVAEMTGTSGVRQLIIDQSIGAMEAAANRWLDVIAPNFAIYFSTQTETDRETFEEGVITPSGNLEPWSELSGAQSVAVALAVRLGLAEVGGAAHGVRYQTLYLDEADAWLSGDYQQTFMEYINKVAETGIDIVCITHIEAVKEMVDQQTLVIDTGNGTSEIWQ